MKEALKNHKVFDELYTPDYAVEPLLKYIPRDVHNIWAPCDTEDSRIVQVLSNNGFHVWYSHIEDGHDFLLEETKMPYDMIITNPPFSIKDKIIRRSYELGKPFALLLPLKALEGQKRGEMWGNGGIGVVVLDNRVDYNGKGSCWYNTSWFIHSKMTDGRLFFEHIVKEEK